MLEVIFTLAVFAIIILMFGATFPGSFKSGAKSADYLQASLLARHKIDQMRQAGYNHLNATDLQQLGITDSTTAAADGSYSFATVDRLVTSGTNQGYFGPSGVATGKIWIGQALTGQGASAPNTRWAKQITVTVTWSNASDSGSFTTHTICAAP